MKKVVILGASGHAHVIADIVTACGDKVEAFLDDDLSIPGISDPISDYDKYLDCEFVIGIPRSCFSRLNCFLCYIINDIVNMCYIATCKYSRNSGLKVLIKTRSHSFPVDFKSKRLAQFILRNKTTGKKQSITHNKN